MSKREVGHAQGATQLGMGATTPNFHTTNPATQQLHAQAEQELTLLMRLTSTGTELTG